MNRIQTVLALVCLLVVGLFVAPAQSHAQIQWNPQCALEAAQKFAACKSAGGGNFGCLVGAGFHYWTCSGSTFNTRTKLRAAIVGRRALRRAGM